jgi:catechol 2,3-dioxygenase-like lactoylglutathione lyase family enzyme
VQIEKADFVAIPSRDGERSARFYGETLGLRPDPKAQYEFWAANTCLGIWEPERMGMEFQPRRTATLRSGSRMSRRREQSSRRKV